MVLPDMSGSLTTSAALETNYDQQKYLTSDTITLLTIPSPLVLPLLLLPSSRVFLLLLLPPLLFIEYGLNCSCIRADYLLENILNVTLNYIFNKSILGSYTQGVHWSQRGEVGSREKQYCARVLAVCVCVCLYVVVKYTCETSNSLKKDINSEPFLISVHFSSC